MKASRVNADPEPGGAGRDAAAGEGEFTSMFHVRLVTVFEFSRGRAGHVITCTINPATLNVVETTRLSPRSGT